MALGVHSEVGTLRKVMVHRPGLEGADHPRRPLFGERLPGLDAQAHVAQDLDGPGAARERELHIL